MALSFIERTMGAVKLDVRTFEEVDSDPTSLAQQSVSLCSQA
jgi:hypothetical protein